MCVVYIFKLHARCAINDLKHRRYTIDFNEYSVKICVWHVIWKWSSRERERKREKNRKQKKNAHNNIPVEETGITAFQMMCVCGVRVTSHECIWHLCFDRKLHRRFFSHCLLHLYFQRFIEHFYIRFTPVVRILANFSFRGLILIGRRFKAISVSIFEFPLLFWVRWPSVTLKKKTQTLKEYLKSI